MNLMIWTPRDKLLNGGTEIKLFFAWVNHGLEKRSDQGINRLMKIRKNKKLYIYVSVIDK